MSNTEFFFGSGKLRIWYFLFYLLGLPFFILGTFLFSQLQFGKGPQGGEFVLSILAIGYLLLGFFSMVNTILYVHKTHKYFLGSLCFFGIQIAFWFIGYSLGNNYQLLLLFFIVTLSLIIYLNLKALSYLHISKHTPHYTTH
jgi:hypothetical protein